MFKDYHRSVTPLTYALLFPEGTDGWTIGQKLPNGTDDLHHMQYLRYHIMSQQNTFNVLHPARKLYQQFIVDEFERHQTMELALVRNNQKPFEQICSMVYTMQYEIMTYQTAAEPSFCQLLRLAVIDGIAQNTRMQWHSFKSKENQLSSLP